MCQGSAQSPCVIVSADHSRLVNVKKADLAVINFNNVRSDADRDITQEMYPSTSKWHFGGSTVLNIASTSYRYCRVKRWRT
jgi:hypothetical protein